MSLQSLLKRLIDLKSMTCTVAFEDGFSRITGKILSCSCGKATSPVLSEISSDRLEKAPAGDDTSPKVSE